MRSSVLKTLSFFDMFDYPLTAEELFFWAWEGRGHAGAEENALVRSASNISLADFMVELDALVADQVIERENSFYVLPGRSAICKSRKLIAPDLRIKMRVAKRAARLIRFVPFVRAFFVCNLFAVSTKEGSDIDTFIVVKKGRMWIARALTVFLFHIFRLRIRGDNSVNKICLSFYADDEHLDMSGIAITEPDIYLIYWIAQLIPVFDSNRLAHKVAGANTWIKKYLPRERGAFIPSHSWSVRDTIITKWSRTACEWLLAGVLGGTVENIMRAIQIKKIEQKCLSVIPGKTDIIISNQMLKFHENDRRELFRDKWQEMYEKYN